jgi:antirestriction protein ArdC/uncharacterized protein (DUF736 family)
MATIGTFTAQGDGYTGSIKTLTLNVKAAVLRPNEKSDDKAPDFRIFAGQTEFGAAWKKTSQQNRDYLSVKLDDPSFPAPIYASLVEVEGGHSLIWSRCPQSRGGAEIAPPLLLPTIRFEEAMMRPAAPARPDIHARITQQIVSQLEAGVRPWTRPWSHSASVSRPLRHDGTPYNGINVVLLWGEAADRGYTRSTWMTFRQALALGAHVRKGERGATVVYANQIVRDETDDTGADVQQRIPFLKAYTVFNVDQIEGLPDHYDQPETIEINPDERIARLDAFFEHCGAEVRHGGGSAYYAPGPDHVQMPPFECFETADAYYSTLGHEMTHWTRHPTRLDRDFGRQRFGDAGYAREELVAELGAAFLCADLGLALEPRDDHAAYIASWLQVLKDDVRFVVSAASHAQKAVDHLKALQPPP